MANNENIHLSIQVIGRVQGVFFRASTKKVADSLKINGTVANLIDGSVQIEAEGSESQLEQLIQWCRDGGPPHARVDDIQILDKGNLNMKGFKIIN